MSEGHDDGLRLIKEYLELGQDELVEAGVDKHPDFGDQPMIWIRFGKVCAWMPLYSGKALIKVIAGAADRFPNDARNAPLALLSAAIEQCVGVIEDTGFSGQLH